MKAPRYVVDAIHTLVDYCNEHPHCDNCAIKDENGCAIDHFPDYRNYSFEEVENDTSKL